MLHIRPVGDDLRALLNIERACYPQALNESESVMQARLAQAPDTCWMLLRETTPVGYLLAYRSTLGAITPLNGAFCVAAKANCLYLHDLAILPEQQGTGAGQALIAHARQWAVAQQLFDAALVSVGNRVSYWTLNEFRIAEMLSGEQRAALLSYGEDARYMTQRWAATHR